MRALLGVDVGASTIAGGLVSEDGEVLSVVQRPTRGPGQGSPVETCFAIVAAVVAEADRGGLALEGIGVGLAGAVDAHKGMHSGTRNHLPEFAQVPLAEQIEAVTGRPAFLDNDANALALAEWTFGLGRGADSLVLLAVGTEIGGALILDGRLIRGRHGFAGELGHVPIDFGGPPCYCGGRGCLGLYVGGRQMAAEARRRILAEPGSALLGMAGGEARAITTELVFAAAAAGDRVAGAIVDQACQALGAGLAIVVNGLNPDVVVVTGGVAFSLSRLEDEVRRRAGQYAFPHPLADTRIHIVGADKRQTVRGGAALALYELGRRG